MQDSGATYARSFVEIPREYGFEPLRVEGKLPMALAGTMFRNGPGLFSVFDHRYRHWFDGDGLITAVRFREGRADGAARLIRSRGLEEERRRGRAYFGAYGTKSPGRWNPWRAVRFVREGGKNPANTSVLCWDDRVFALCEVGRPTEIDPATLETIGESDLGGAIHQPFSAHPHRIADTGYVYNFGTRLGRPNVIDLYALRPDGSAGRIAEIPLAYPTLVHDFAATSRYLVLFLAPLEISLYRVLFGRVAFSDAMNWVPERGSEVVIVPLDAPASPIRFKTEPFWAWHMGNAFERDGEIVVDLFRYSDFPTSAGWLDGVMRGAPGGAVDGVLHRVRIDVLRRRLRTEKMRERTGEFPRVAPFYEGRSHRFLFCAEHSSFDVARRGLPDTLVRIDAEGGSSSEYRFEEHESPSEGVFVPRPNASDPDDGWLVSLVYDARLHRSHWAVFDVNHLCDGPLAKVHLEHHVPLGFHGAWASEGRGP